MKIILTVLILLYVFLAVWMVIVAWQLFRGTLKERKMRIGNDNRILPITAGMSPKKKKYIQTKNMLRRMRTDKTVQPSVLSLDLDFKTISRLYARGVIDLKMYHELLERRGIKVYKGGKDD